MKRTKSVRIPDAIGSSKNGMRFTEIQHML